MSVTCSKAAQAGLIVETVKQLRQKTAGEMAKAVALAAYASRQ